MMQPRHHLDPSTIIAYATGTLSTSLMAVAATHLEGCARCRQWLVDAEHIGGLLVEQQQPAYQPETRQQNLRGAMLARLDETAPATLPHASLRQARAAMLSDSDLLPAPLHTHFGERYSELRWNWTAPGVHLIRAPRHPGLILLKIAPGKSMPMHSHGGNELTQILRGAYDDVLGHFAPGDVADLGSDIEHQPVTSPGIACVCVSALDAPLRFSGRLARLLQPLIRI